MEILMEFLIHDFHKLLILPCFMITGELPMEQVIREQEIPIMLRVILM
jgi:hypothetical protein